MAWRVAKSLKALLNQVNAKWPGRGKTKDGTIGDKAHQKKGNKSDHNPWVLDGAQGVVTALDITHDPANGCDAGVIAEAIRASRDARIKYIIWNKRICHFRSIAGQPSWTWRKYTGENPHTIHVHISVRSMKERYDSTTAWQV